MEKHILPALSSVIDARNPFEQGMLTKGVLLKSLYRSLFKKSEFSELEYFCLFIGHPRSGHTAVAALLDAHPNILISNELNALNLIRLGIFKRLLLEMLFVKSEHFANTGRIWSGHSFLVNEAWHGKHEKLKIIGDKKGDRSSILLAYDDSLLEKLRKTVKLPLKFIHVIRNPFDNIARYSIRSRRTIEQGIEEYFAVYDCVEDVRSKLSKNEWHFIHQEFLIENPEKHISELCDFLAQPCPSEYLSKAASLVYSEPNLSRKEIAWTKEQINEIENRIQKYEHLAHYRYE